MTQSPSNIIDSIPSTQFYGWYSPALQQLRLSNPTFHKFNGKIFSSPPYTYWYKDGKKILVTEITETSDPTPRQIKNNDIYLGRLDKYCCRSYVLLKENNI
jgi:hypothetical protein